MKRGEADRVDDVLNATRAAVEEGILPGGGKSAAARHSAVLDGIKTINADQKTGVDIVRKAIQDLGSSDRSMALALTAL